MLIKQLVKQKQLNCWFWRWHIIGGLVCLPFMLLLSVTGILYLFKADYNNLVYQDILQIDAPVQTPSPVTPVSYSVQLDTIQKAYAHPVTQLLLPQQPNEAIGFRLHTHGGGHARNMVYTNPYTGKITGEILQKQTLMYKIRKLHGELLLDTLGTLVIELVASWFVVLILTGLYIWWPAKKFSLSGFFTIRNGGSRRIFWRDMHAVLGFWLSIFMLIILAGGMPWTDVFGKNLKWVQKQTDSGYPKHWRSSKGLSSTSSDKPSLSLDDMVAIAKQQELKGRVTIKLPMDADGVFTLKNRAFWLSDQRVMHFDQYSGELIKSLDWGDVGILMDARQVAMRLHQGEYGRISWYLVLLVTLLFTITTLAGLIAYLIRKPQGRWGLPEVPENFNVGFFVLASIIALGLLFPLFGLSIILLWMIDLIGSFIKEKRAALESQA